MNVRALSVQLLSITFSKLQNRDMLCTAYAAIICAFAGNVLSLQNDPPRTEALTDAMLNTTRRLCPRANICSNNNLSDAQKEKTSCCGGMFCFTYKIFKTCCIVSKKDLSFKMCNELNS